MGWLDKLEYDYLYVCATCGGETISSTREDACPCAHEGCGGTAGFVKMIPMELGLSGKVAFDQNGRKAYMIQGKKGRRPTYISATKYHYLETGEIKPQYTREYEQQVMKESPEYLEGDTNMNRAGVKRVRRGEKTT